MSIFARTRRTLDEAEAISLEIEVGALGPILDGAMGRLSPTVTGVGAPVDIIPTVECWHPVLPASAPIATRCPACDQLAPYTGATPKSVPYRYHASAPVFVPEAPIGGPCGCFDDECPGGCFI